MIRRLERGRVCHGISALPSSQDITDSQSALRGGTVSPCKCDQARMPPIAEVSAVAPAHAHLNCLHCSAAFHLFMLFFFSLFTILGCFLKDMLQMFLAPHFYSFPQRQKRQTKQTINKHPQHFQKKLSKTTGWAVSTSKAPDRRTCYPIVMYRHPDLEL